MLEKQTMGILLRNVMTAKRDDWFLSSFHPESNEPNRLPLFVFNYSITYTYYTVTCTSMNMETFSKNFPRI